MALVVLLLNDWWAKAACPGWVTGKLSDVAGLVLAPVAMTAAVGVGLSLLAAWGLARDPSLRRRRVAAAVVLVAVGFVATKVWPPAASTVAAALGLLGGRPRIVYDPTDLLALPAVLVAWRIGQAELALVPRGYAHAALRARSRGEAPSARARLVEVRRAGASAAAVDQLALALASGSATEVNAALRTLAGR